MEQDPSARIVKFLTVALGVLISASMAIWLASNLDLVFKAPPPEPPVASEPDPALPVTAPVAPPKAVVPPSSQSRMMVVAEKDDSVAPEQAAAEAQQKKAETSKKKNWRKSLGGSLGTVDIYNRAP